MSRVSRDRATLRRLPRWRGLSGAGKITIFVIAFLSTVAFFTQAEENALHDSSFTTGYLLLGSVIFLAAYNLRKKFPTLSLGSSRTWMQLHLAVGWSAIGILLLHLEWRLPGGGLGWLLLTLFAIVAGSGIFGLYLTRAIPKRLATLPEEVIYEQIPAHKRAVATAAKQIALRSAESTDVTAQLYQEHLAPFFEMPRSPWYFIRPTGQLRRSLQRMTDGLDRFLPADQRQLRDQLRKLILKKDDLDFQHALQLRLKAWLFMHIGFTYGLLLVSLFHGLTAHAFQGVS